MVNKKLIDELSELAQICLDYKNHVEFEKKQQQKWLNESLDILSKKWDDVYQGIVWFLTYNTTEHSLVKERMDQFSVALARFIDDYKKEEEENNEN